MKTSLDLRPSPIAGQWYPADPVLLATSVDGYLQAARLPEIGGQVIAVIAPHAGHRYSGTVAGSAFATILGAQPELVAVVSPMHHPFPQALLTTAHEAYETPLGPIQVDLDAVQELDDHLQATSGIGLSRVSRDPEHSLEIELPFLQRALAGEFRLLPVMMREQSARVARSLGSALAQVLRGRHALLVASSDLSHFYSQAIAAKLDTELLKRVQAFDPEAVIGAEEEAAGFACGRGAIAAVLWAARALDGDRVQTLHYATSGDVTGDTTSVVGYGAAVVTRPAG